MKKMKKALSLIMTMMMVFSLAACGEDTSVDSTDVNAAVETEETTTATEEETVVAEEETPTASAGEEAAEAEYPWVITTTGQADSYDNDGNIIDPAEGQAFYGQDADYDSAAPSFTDNGDGTVTDNNTGLTWIQIPVDELMTWEGAVEYCENLEFAGYDDWRIPTSKELFGLSDFSEGWPFLDTDYFGFPEGSESGGPGDGGPQGSGSEESSEETVAEMPEGGPAGGPQGGGPQGSGEAPEGAPAGGPPSDGEMPADGNMPEGTDKAAGASLASGEGTSEGGEGEMPPPPPSDSRATDDGSVSKQQGQFWSSNFYYVGTTHGDHDSAFGVNHATGHIKAYPSDVPAQMGKYVRAVRGDEVATNDFADNGDGTVTDEATGLMWMSVDAGQAMEWEAALAYAENSEYAGYDDWRLPDVKELQSIVDYSGVYPAIDGDYFECTELEDNINYYFWTNTSAYFSTELPDNAYAWYVAFGKAVGDDGEDSHGAGAVRFSPKYEESPYAGEGGDNVLNSVRLVRNVTE